MREPHESVSVCVAAVAGAALRLGAHLPLPLSLRPDKTALAAAYNAYYARPPDAFFPALAANVLGAAVLGVLHALRTVVPVPLAPALGVGFCGALTSFSAWQGAVALRFLTAPTALAAVQCLLIGLLLMLVAYGAARWAVLTCLALDDSEMGDTEDEVIHALESDVELDSLSIANAPRPRLAPNLVLLYSMATVLFTTLAACAPSLPVALTLILSSAGSLARHLLDRFNRRCPQFPLFTLLPNLVACFVWVLAYPYPALHALVLEGLCGGLSTASTWAGQLLVLPLVWSFLYASVSVLGAQALLLGVFLLT